MKTYLKLILALLISSSLVASVNQLPEVKMTAAKDQVVSVQSRAAILEVAEACLNRSDEAFSAAIGGVQNPFPFFADTAVDSGVTEASITVYDDKSILELINKNFSSQIRGNIAKGGVYYLQLNGGGLLEAGDSFPAQIPQVEGRSFSVTISEITPDGYVLSMNETVQKVNFEKKSGIIKNSAK